jgi:hypothetical protein
MATLGIRRLDTVMQRVVFAAPAESRFLYPLSGHVYHLEKSEQTGRRTAYVRYSPISKHVFGLTP